MKAWIERWLSRNAIAEKAAYHRVDRPDGSYSVVEQHKGHTYRIRTFFGIEFKQLIHYYY